MRALLTASIPVERFAVFAEMAWLERRPELGLLCRAAREHGGAFTEAIAQSALPGVSGTGARNIIQWCRLLELCDRHGGLTALGEEVADTDEAPVPEQGVYDFWMVSHPVLGRRLLAVDRLAADRDQRFDLVKTLRIEPDRGVPFASVRDASERFVLRSLPSNNGDVGMMRKKTSATCRFEWTLDFSAGEDAWTLNGTIESSDRTMMPLHHVAESDGLDLWNVVDGWGRGSLARHGEWQAGARRLAVSFDPLSVKEQDAFRKSLVLDEAPVPGKGSYIRVALEDVPICPRTADDAQRWAMARLHRRLSSKPSYRSRSEVRQLFAGLTEGTSLEEHRPALPQHDDLVRGEVVAKSDELYWNLNAPVDLSPFPTGIDALGELQVGAPIPTDGATLSPAKASTSATLSVPYRGGWSMERLVDELLAGATPSAVLLCDRYVRGEQNLEALRLLLEALEAVSPGVELEVWTRKNGRNLDRIEHLTGCQPRAYEEKFGGAHPHDRYVLVRTWKGLAFGWQLTNSPLHARADVEEPGRETPLRWKDMGGQRVVPGALEPALRRWLVGGQ